MPNILTLYFAGSGHGLEHNDDSMVVAYKKTVGPKMFFPGPGGKDNTIYRMGFIDTTNMFSDDKIVRTNTPARVSIRSVRPPARVGTETSGTRWKRSPIMWRSMRVPRSA